MACNSAAEATKNSTSSTINEDALVTRLASEMFADPQTQAERDQNRIINYAIDHLLDIRATNSGLYYRIIEAGEGPPASWGDYVTVNYTGKFLDGRIFDQARDYKFYVGNMIKGWNEGLQMLKKGGEALFLIPSRLAYGSEGAGSVIPPDEVLMFEIELIKIEKR